MRRRTAGISLDDAHVVVTGATGGVGAALARELARRGARITLVARRVAELEALADETGGSAVRADLSDMDQVTPPGSGPHVRPRSGRRAHQQRRARRRRTARRQRAEDVRTTVLANLWAPLELTRQCLPSMLERQRGAIVNVSSLVGEAPLPNTATYAPTKAGLSQFTVNLQRELRRSRLTVMQLVLGSIEGTTLNEAGLADPVVARVASRFNRLPSVTAPAVAQRTADAIEAGRQLLVLPPAAAPAVHFRQLPGRLTSALMTGVD